MKKAKYNAYFRLFVCMTIFIGLVVSCSEDNDESPGKGNVVLLSFGPCPIPRGGELRILGTNLDRVESVILPGSGAISDIKRIDNAEIRIIVPKTAENGKIILKAGDKEITSLSILSIDGTIALTGFSPLIVKAGDIIKIEGEDLDFVEEVIFTSDIHVIKDDFVSRSRESIEVTVPIEAQSGELAVSNGATSSIPLVAYFEEELQVILPTITSFSPGTIRAGSVLTITGKDFDLVEGVSFGGATVAESFDVNEAKTSITVTVPVNAQDGPVVLTAFSGVKVSGATDLIMAVPTIASIAPNPVKAGEELTVKGTDLDLINQVAFGGGKQPGLITPGGTATEIKVQVPSNAKTGTVVFTTLANKTVETAEELAIIIEGESTETVVFEGPVSLTWSTGGRAVVLASDLEGVPAGSILTIYFTQNANWGQAQINDGGWAVVPGLGINGYLKTGEVGDKSVTSHESVLTQEVLDLLDAKKGIFGEYNQTEPAAIIIQGSDWIVDKITIKVMGGGGIGTTDPVTDPSLVIFNFDDRDAGSWGGGVSPSPNDDGPSGKFFEITQDTRITGGWTWLFASNEASFYEWLPQVSGISNYVLKFDIRFRNDVVVPDGNSWCMMQFRMGGPGDLDLTPWVKEDNVFSTGGKWRTVTIPLSSLGISDPTPTSGEWGFIINQGSPVADFVGFCVDNVRYEKIN